MINGYIYGKKFLWKAFLFVVMVTLLFTGCSKKDNNSTALKGSAVETRGSDLLDPENIEFDNGTGAKVTADDLYHQSGKANGIDVSKWQGKINWSKVKSSGIDFAIIRIGFRGENGTIYKDSYADYNIQQAENAGVLVGVYFSSTAVNKNEAEEEAKWSVAAIQGYPISYPVVYDCEGFLSAESRMSGMTNSQRTSNALAFLNYVSNSGYEGMFYAAKSELEASTYWDTATLQSSYKIFIARYTDVPYPTTPNPNYTGKYDMWQYTNRGSVNGISGNNDMIVSYFTREKVKAKNPSASSEKATLPTESDKIYTAATDSVTAKELTNLRDSASTKSNIVATIRNSEFVTKTGESSKGWTRIDYNGRTVYAKTNLLTTEINQSQSTSQVSSSDSTGLQFTEVNEQVTAKDETNLRSKPSSKDDSPIVYTLKKVNMLQGQV